MMNHSCNPNVEITFLDDNRVVVTALRDIKEGEEVTFSYIDEEASVGERRLELKERYRFNCSCWKCLADLTTVAGG